MINKLIFFLIIFFCFTSCKKAISDDSKTESSKTNCLLSSWDEGNFKVKYEYDSQGRTVKQTFTDFGAIREFPQYRTFDYSMNKISVTEYPSKENIQHTLTNGKITRLYYPYDKNEYSDITYNSDGYISTITDKKGFDDGLRTFQYSNGNLISFTYDKQTYLLEYYDKPSVKGFDLGLDIVFRYEYMVSDGFDPYQILTDFLGKQSKNLIKRFVFPNGEYIRFDYGEFDSAGKPSKVAISIDGKSGPVDLTFKCN